MIHMSDKGFAWLLIVVPSLLVLVGFIIVLLGITTNQEIKLYDKVHSGLSVINYFYLSEKNIKEFIPLVIETTAKELGEICGGYDCPQPEDCYWTTGCPTLDNSKEKYNNTLIGKINGFPKNIGTLGELNFTPPNVTKISFSDNWINLSAKSHIVERQEEYFSVNATGDDTSVSKEIRYLLLLKVGRLLFEKGNYPITWGGTKTIYFESGSTGNWRYDYCNNLRNTKPIQISNYNINMPVDNFLEEAIKCGVDDVDGLASIDDFYGERTESGNSNVDCLRTEALADTKYSDVDDKVNDVIKKLDEIFEELYPDMNFAISTRISDSGTNCDVGNYCFDTNLDKSVPSSDSGCGTCNSYCSPGSCTSDTTSCSCSFSQCTSGKCGGSCGCDIDERNGEWKTRVVDEKWNSDKSYYWIDVYQMNHYYYCTSDGTCGICEDCGGEDEPPCDCHTNYKYGDSYSYYYYCEYKENFKFFAYPDLEIKITDETIKIPVKSGGGNYDNLFLKIKFKNSYELKP